MPDKMTNCVLHIKGMTCAACEQRIQNSLAGLAGVISVDASYSSGMVAVTYDSKQVTLKQMEDALAEHSYYVVEKKQPSKVRQWLLAGAVLVGVAAGYWLMQVTGVLYFFPMAEKQTALPMLFVIGLLTSVHCVAMCGGINISQCARVPQASSKGKRLLPSLLYNAGRVISYTIIGGIVGGIGAVVTPSGQFKGAITIAAAVFMVIMGLNLLGIIPGLRKLVPRMPKKISGKINSEKVGKGPFVVGILNGFMPCGPLQAMQLYALSTGSVAAGALSMFLFSLGTVPLMFGLGALSSFLSARFTSVMMKVSAVLVILLGLMMLNNGLSLSGINPIF